jgi:hypothetical protein
MLKDIRLGRDCGKGSGANDSRSDLDHFVRFVLIRVGNVGLDVCNM